MFQLLKYSNIFPLKKCFLIKDSYYFNSHRIYLFDPSAPPGCLSTFCRAWALSSQFRVPSVCVWCWWLTAFSVSIAIAFSVRLRIEGVAWHNKVRGWVPGRSYLRLTLGQRVAIYAFHIDFPTLALGFVSHVFVYWISNESISYVAFT